LRSYQQALPDLGLAAPAYIFFSLLGVTGCVLAGDNRFTRRAYYADRDALILPELLVEDWSIESAEAMRPLFDMVWNAFGYERSFNYDENGHWTER